MLKMNGLPTVVVPGEVPSGDVFGAKMAESAGIAASSESVVTGGSGFQEEGYMEMMSLGEGEAQRRDAGGVQRDTRPKEQREMRQIKQSIAFRSREELTAPMIEKEEQGAIALKGGEERQRTREKDKGVDKATSHYIEDILVDESSMSAEDVIEYLIKFGLIKKTSNICSK